MLTEITEITEITEQSFEFTNKGIKISGININFENMNKSHIKTDAKPETIKDSELVEVKERTIFNKYKISQYIELCKMDINEFQAFFENTMNKFELFKKMELDNQQKINEYFNNCQFIYLLQLFNIIKNNDSTERSFFKVLNNNIIIDDCFIIDKTNNTKTLSSELRGFELYKSFDVENKKKIIDTLYGYIKELKKILFVIYEDKYDNFLPSDFLFLLANSLYNKNNITCLSLISSEIHPKIYELSNEEKLYLFDDSEKINNLWNDRTFKIQSKLRIVVLYLFMKRNPSLFF
jgi:hypothetical protein